MISVLLDTSQRLVIPEGSQQFWHPFVSECTRIPQAGHKKNLVCKCDYGFS